MKNTLISLGICFYCSIIFGQITDPVATEVWKPVPRVVTSLSDKFVPSDAIVLFDGKDLSQWKSADSDTLSSWTTDGDAMTVKPSTGAIETKQNFGSIQLHIGMIGGGQGAFIGEVHRMAARLDGHIELVCGAFSSKPEKSKASGEALYLAPDRVYGTYEEMIKTEATLPEGERMDFVSIVTPNHLHFAPAKMALEHGFHVICDKPVTFSTEQALELQQLVGKTGLCFALTHNYTGYPMVKEAKAMIAAGELGKLRRAIVEYPQGWLSTRLESSGQKQADWRTDPKRSGN